MTRQELVSEIDAALMRMVPSDSSGDPNMSMLRKASSAHDQIMAVVDRYLAGR